MLNDSLGWTQQNLDNKKAIGRQLRLFINCKEKKKKVGGNFRKRLKRCINDSQCKDLIWILIFLKKNKKNTECTFNNIKGVTVHSLRCDKSLYLLKIWTELLMDRDVFHLIQIV